MRILFFPYCIKEWLKLGDEIPSIESSKRFKITVLDFIRPKKKTVLDFVRPKENSIYAIHEL